MTYIKYAIIYLNLNLLAQNEYKNTLKLSNRKKFSYEVYLSHN